MNDFVLDVVLHQSLGSRIRGLLGTDDHAQQICILKCCSIHTIGMMYPIDVCFINSAMSVVGVQESLGPNLHYKCREAVCVIERPASDAPWPELGDNITLKVIKVI